MPKKENKIDFLVNLDGLNLAVGAIMESSKEQYINGVKEIEDNSKNVNVEVSKLTKKLAKNLKKEIIKEMSIYLPE